MPAAIDITGQRYGRLIAISVAAKNPRTWNFLCDCGEKIVRQPGLVRFGSVRSCGCLRKDTTSSLNKIELVGHRSGKLLVLSECEERSKHGAVRWNCSCDCGKKKIVTTRALKKSKPTESCGCIRSEMMRQLGLSSKQENPISRTAAYKKQYKDKKRQNPVFAMAERMSRMICFGVAAVGVVKGGKTFDLLGYTPAQLAAHLEKQFMAGMTWDNRGQWEIDHIIPISSAKSKEDVIALNCLSNLRPLWAKDNNAKRDKLLTLL